MATLTKDAEIQTISDLTNNVYAEIIDLLAQGGGPEAIIAFRSSEAMQDRAYDLVYAKRERRLTEAEQEELAAYEQREHLVRMAKIRARLMLQERETQKRE